MTLSTPTRTPETATPTPGPTLLRAPEATPVDTSTESSAGMVLLRVFALLALLGAGSFFLVKPLVESLRQDAPLPLPRRTVATRQDFPLVQIPSSVRSPNRPTQPTTAEADGSGAPTEIPSGAADPLVPTPSLDQGQTNPPSEEVRLIPPGARQPGSVEAPPAAPLPTMPLAADPTPAAPASQQIALPNSMALRRTVRNLARSLPSQSQPSPTIAASPQMVARLPLPEEPYFPGMAPNALNATGTVPGAVPPTPGPSIPLTIQP
ncbi:MAG: hypothetical protein VKJ64_13590, partial [Leptolyngbyaceae bacterium]|nr:hypothetical protein [Leptolyngbyaceae bacterium]